MVKIGVLLPKLSKKISQGSHLFWTTRVYSSSFRYRTDDMPADIL